ncbi:MAG: hypothetical protein LC791_02615 [Acidobacteria bacterium]|nr:hypothetical protein [Acidobacteriota bacterium]
MHADGFARIGEGIASRDGGGGAAYGHRRIRRQMLEERDDTHDGVGHRQGGARLPVGEAFRWGARERVGRPDLPARRHHLVVVAQIRLTGVVAVPGFERPFCQWTRSRPRAAAIVGKHVARLGAMPAGIDTLVVEKDRDSASQRVDRYRWEPLGPIVTRPTVHGDRRAEGRSSVDTPLEDDIGAVQPVVAGVDGVDMAITGATRAVDCQRGRVIDAVVAKDLIHRDEFWR